ncbi:conserved hypothetical protein [Candida dubliniensis CD36]|uniref:SH3 domain-containing protein n=1 Tax=Candida dubliniensis (strain CD36 / ATCC MYA-646 / CBS 7987 / NCPF 3949 / NRRL Y-17841) TaxID=573826 RepID=B9WC50_CANDC|nr:conserved hypothetical protein [Candida dubliniensis CD36]CAX43972.1 conserved hypothetical protein [Candida dubliniensis CD36]
MVVEQLKNNIVSISSNIGTHIKDGYKYTESEFKNISYNIKDTVTFHTRDYNKDDELIEIYYHDIKQSISGLKYITSQNHHLCKSFLPHVLSSNIKIIKGFINLIGQDSLRFDKINEYYQEFDLWQATQEIPHVHPKEMQFLNESINEELSNYLVTVENLKFDLENNWEAYDESLKYRIDEMKKYLKKALKLIKKRNMKRTEQDHLHRKIEKLNQKAIPLDEKDNAKLEKLETTYQTVDAAFNSLNKRCVELLPNIVSFLDEFVENITKMILCQQLETYKKLTDTFQYFTEFYGLIAEIEPQSYTEIIDDWESNSTATRLQIESLLTIVHDKQPELLDKEINDEDSSSNYYKFWRNMSNKFVEKKHVVSTKDKVNGIFNDSLEIDPLVAYKQYQDPSMNLSETYHPRKLIDEEDIKVPVVPKKDGPELPPRSNTAIMRHSVLVSPMSSAGASRLYSISTDSMDSISLSDFEDETATVMSEASSISSMSTGTASYSNQDSSDTKLRRIYNSSKNDIKESPITNRPVQYDTFTFEKPMSLTYKLNLIQHFFEKLDIHTDNKVLKTAKYDFNGSEPGDLSFKQGDSIEILLDFQNIDTLYHSDELNWLIGVSRVDDDNYRIGFVPNNYVE